MAGMGQCQDNLKTLARDFYGGNPDEIISLPAISRSLAAAPRAISLCGIACVNKRLVKGGRERCGCTPLHYAADRGHFVLAMVRYMCEQGTFDASKAKEARDTDGAGMGQGWEDGRMGGWPDTLFLG